MSVIYVDNFFREFKAEANYLLVTDSNVFNIYKKEILSVFSKDRIHIIEAGESSKSIEELQEIYKSLIDLELGRQDSIIALGGGVVGDLAGFAAASYKRGIGLIQVATSLLAQLDSSVGSKTAIDFLGYKNIIGAFYSPKEVYIDISFLDSLPNREITSGVGEALKYGLIDDYSFFEYLISNREEIYRRDRSVLGKVVKKSIATKEKIVGMDMYESNIRKKLNFGHTIGHGIESSIEGISHGEAVIQGMIYESLLAQRLDIIDGDISWEIINGLRKFSPVRSFEEEDIDRIIHFMKNDKKNRSGEIGFLLPSNRGSVEFFFYSKEEVLREVLGEILEN